MDPRVLIVEHELVTAEPLVLMLTWSGFAVERVHEAGEALARMRARRPDVVLANAKLPGRASGLELCRQVRRDPALSGVPVVLFAAADEADVPWHEAGATAFLRKPIGLRLLPALLRQLLLVNGDGRSAEVPLPAG